MLDDQDEEGLFPVAAYNCFRGAAWLTLDWWYGTLWPQKMTAKNLGMTNTMATTRTQES